jgi:hypothetical protein
MNLRFQENGARFIAGASEQFVFTSRAARTHR